MIVLQFTYRIGGYKTLLSVSTPLDVLQTMVIFGKFLFKNNIFFLWKIGRNDNCEQPKIPKNKQNAGVLYPPIRYSSVNKFLNIFNREAFGFCGAMDNSFALQSRGTQFEFRKNRKQDRKMAIIQKWLHEIFSKYPICAVIQAYF